MYALSESNWIVPRCSLHWYVLTVFLTVILIIYISAGGIVLLAAVTFALVEGASAGSKTSTPPPPSSSGSFQKGSGSMARSSLSAGDGILAKMTATVGDGVAALVERQGMIAGMYLALDCTFSLSCDGLHTHLTTRYARGLCRSQVSDRFVRVLGIDQAADSVKEFSTVTVCSAP